MTGFHRLRAAGSGSMRLHTENGNIGQRLSAMEEIMGRRMFSRLELSV